MVPGGGFEPPTRGFSIRINSVKNPYFLGSLDFRVASVLHPHKFLRISVRQKTVFDCLHAGGIVLGAWEQEAVLVECHRNR